MRNKKKLLLLVSVFTLVLVVAALNVGMAQYFAIKDGWASMNTYAASRFYIDDGGSGGDGGGSKKGGNPTLTSITITRVGAGSMDTDPGYITANGTRVLARLEFRASYSDAKIKRIQFGVSGSSTAPMGLGLDDDVSGVSLRQCSTVDCSVKSDVPGLTNLPIITSGSDAGTAIAYDPSGFFTVPRGESRYFHA